MPSSKRGGRRAAIEAGAVGDRPGLWRSAGPSMVERGASIPRVRWNASIVPPARPAVRAARRSAACPSMSERCGCHRRADRAPPITCARARHPRLETASSVRCPWHPIPSTAARRHATDGELALLFGILPAHVGRRERSEPPAIDARPIPGFCTAKVNAEPRRDAGRAPACDAKRAAVTASPGGPIADSVQGPGMVFTVGRRECCR